MFCVGESGKRSCRLNKDEIFDIEIKNQPTD